MPDPQSVSTSVLPRQLPEGRRRIGDIGATRAAIYQNVHKAAESLPPISNSRHTLTIHDVRYESPEHYTLKEQKEHILGGKTLARRLRGTWRLSDTATGNVLDEKRTTLANVPHMTQRGTFILNGSEYILSHALRLRPGVYSRQKGNGELEAHVNTVGRGTSHRVFLDPETGVFRLSIGQAKIPLLPLLRTLGATDQELDQAWGALRANNQKHDSPHHVDKLYQRLVKRADPNAPEEHKRAALAKAIEALQLDPEVTKRTLGKPHANLNKDAYLDITKKLLALNRGETEPDDRDHLAYQTVVGPEDILAERIGKDKQSMSQLLWQASFRNGVQHIQPGFFNKAIHAGFLTTGLGQTPEGISATEFLDHAGRVTKMGEGGLGLGSDSIPDESRDVSDSHFGFIDPIKTPESGTAGVDLRFAFGVQKGSDGRVYAPFRDIHSGKLVYRSPQQLTDLTLAFPGELQSGRKHVKAIQDGRMKYVPRDKVDLEAPSMENAFSPSSNLVALKSSAKGQRASMGSRMGTQALPLINPEAPLVRTGVPGQLGKSFEELYGKHMGAVHAAGEGKVEKVTPDEIVVKYADGTTQSHELYSNLPNRKTGITNTPMVATGDTVKPGQLLAKSNFTDDKGHAATGLNTRVAYVPMHGKVYEDAVLISESYAKRATSDHYYQHPVDFDDSTKTGKKSYLSLFPGKYSLKELEHLDENGVPKPGSVIQPGAPLILQARQRELDHAKVTNSPRASFADASVTWDHHNPGIVTDVTPTKKGVNVVVRSYAPTQVGDKLCYDAKTEVLTHFGWRRIYKLNEEDEVACLEFGKLVYRKPIKFYAYKNVGRMYRARGNGLDLLVTDNHRLYCRLPDSPDFDLVPAAEACGKAAVHLKAAPQKGNNDETAIIPAVKIDWKGGSRLTLPQLEVPTETYLKLLALFLRDGWLRKEPMARVKQRRTSSNPYDDRYGRITIRVKDTKRREAVLAEFDTAGIPCTPRTKKPHLLVINCRQIYTHLEAILQGGKLPERITGYSPRLLKVFVSWLKDKGAPLVFESKGMVDSIQILCLHAGVAADVRKRVRIKPGGNKFENHVRVASLVVDYVVQVHKKAEVKAELEELIDDHAGPVFCVEVPQHVLMVRRNGKVVWCGNSGRHGSKSVIADIIPDHQMPHDEQGRPVEMVSSPLSLNSRINPAWAVESALGKIAERTGKPYVIHDFEGRNNVQMALDELAKHGLSDTETLTDPVTGRKIPNVLTGNNFIMKLQHQSESKVQGRGLGAHTAEGAPGRGPGGNPKKMSLGDTWGLLSHGALEVLRDSREHRSGDTNEFWMAYMSGFPMPHAKVPGVYEKFLHELKGAGINVVREGPRLKLMALTDKDVNHLAGNRALKNAETVKFGSKLEPVPGGLFDQALTGSHGGVLWSKLPFAEPLPNPAFADPIKKLLHLTENDYREILAGKKELNGHKGPEALGKALEAIDVPKEIEKARAAIASGKKTARDTAVRKLSYLKSLDRTGLHPRDWMLSAAPVIPPMFRQVSVMAGRRGNLVSDSNLLYKELWDANENLKRLKGHVGDLSEERSALYKAFEGVTGLGDPITPKNHEKGVKGLLRSIFQNSPKYSVIQQKLLGTTVDLAGRGVVTPDPNMSMDEIGLPEASAFESYKPFLVRRLVRNGMPRAAAVKEVTEKTSAARAALMQEMSERPVIVTRYPLLHKYGIISAYPKLVRGDTIRTSPLVNKGLGMDHDGDTLQFHVPVSEKAVGDAVEKMLPSKNLYHAATMKANAYLPNMEYIQGLHAASTARNEDGRPRVFATSRDALRAYKNGEISLGQLVSVIDHDK